jgi:hypothetical protein
VLTRTPFRPQILKEHLPAVAHVMVVGSDKKFLSCLLTLKTVVKPPPPPFTSSTIMHDHRSGITTRTTHQVPHGARWQRTGRGRVTVGIPP